MGLFGCATQRQLRILEGAEFSAKFGKLLGMTVPEILRRAAEETCSSVKAEGSAVDVATVGAVCNLTLNEQGLLSGLLAMTPGLDAKPIESVENACASGGQAILAVAQKLMLGDGDVGLAVGFEKMRDAEGKMDGKLIGKVLGYYSHPDERVGKTFVFPHLFAEVMKAYMDEWGATEEDLAAIAVAEYENARENPFAQMQKSQVTLEYENGEPVRIDAIVVSTQHSDDVKNKQIQEAVRELVIDKVIPKRLVDKQTKVYINPTGRFVLGGPQADCGLTGRKIIVDSYGGMGRHGGGAFSGKDPTKVDRSACYYARYIAKNVVAAKLAKRCEVQVAYAIGVAQPVGVYINTFGTGRIGDETLAAYIHQQFDMRPKAIIEQLDLLRPIYRATAAYGHFGRTEFSWERTDRAAKMADDLLRGAPVSANGRNEPAPKKKEKKEEKKGKKSKRSDAFA